MQRKILKHLFLLLFLLNTINAADHQKPTRPVFPHQPLNTTRFQTRTPSPTLRFILSGALSSIAAAISSAGGIGGGGLYIPILTIFSGLDLKSATSYSAFMVTGGSIASVACHLFSAGRRRKPLIDFEIALLSEPCMLLGVSVGVICNLVFPEWLITVFFAGFLALCTFRTCRSGVLFWKMESEDMDSEITKEPLLVGGEVAEGKVGIPWLKVGMLVVIWFSFFVLYLLRGNRNTQGIINIETCGTEYWLISAIQIPLAIIFTALMLHARRTTTNHTTGTQQGNIGDETRSQCLVFPIMALLAGVLGGVFGIGGGMLISPLLLQIGIEPGVTAATCSFRVLFSSTMSAMQYLLLGMEHINEALTFAAVCFVASLVGLTLVQRAIMKNGRSSLIVFSVGTVMALSTVLMTGFGAVDVWRDYASGKSMGFKKPC